MQKETIVVLDFGGQYNQLIARRVREAGVYSEVLSWETPLAEIMKKQPKGIIFTGGPAVVFDEAAPTVSKAIFEQGIPVLGICYGAQLLVHLLGGSVEAAVDREYGKKMLQTSNHLLFKEIEEETPCWMSHTYQVKQMPEGFAVIGKTDSCPVAALANDSEKIYGVQFHPEVVHTPKGSQLLKNFLFEICACSGDWKMSNIAEKTIQSLKEKIGNKKVLLGLSGGVDSSVAAALLDKAIGDQLTCIFVDNGLLRKNEADEVVDLFTYNFDLNLVPIDARQAFLSKLENISDPEEKRKNIGETFIRVFEAASKDIGGVDFLAQGTIYPDVVESGTKNAAVIKSHHNVGGLPDVVDFEDIVEPLRDLFKDEVRALGRELGLPDFVVDRQPFPGPGLAIRVIGDITEHKLEILREADFIYREEIKKAGLTPWQYFAVLTNLRTVGVMGDERTYHYTVALRAVESIDGMTADWFRIPHDVLAHISNRIVNEVEEVNRVVYDISSKPPATIEWE